MRLFLNYMLRCIQCVAQNSSSSSTVAQRRQKLDTLAVQWSAKRISKYIMAHPNDVILWRSFQTIML